jgi:hypothetical protein
MVWQQGYMVFCLSVLVKGSAQNGGTFMKFQDFSSCSDVVEVIEWII